MKKDNCYNWKMKCEECGKIAHFNKGTFAYYCDYCGWILEV